MALAFGFSRHGVVLMYTLSLESKSVRHVVCLVCVCVKMKYEIVKIVIYVKCSDVLFMFSSVLYLHKLTYRYTCHKSD